MRKRMWMGPRGYEQWVPMPKIEPDYSRLFWSSSTTHLNGGASIAASKGGHNAYAFEWNKGSWADLMPIRDMADGIYDSHDGVNLIYFVEPTSMARNVMPQFWATPALAIEDAPSLYDAVRPTRYVVPQHSRRGLPASQANYDAAPPAGFTPQKLYVPIPPGFTAHFGWLGGPASDGQLTVTDVLADGSNGTVRHPTVLTGGDGDQFFTNLDLPRNDDGRIGLEISVAGTGQLHIRGSMLKLLPSGAALDTVQRWAGGMGHSGCQFVDRAGLTPLSVPLDKVGATATLEETGGWL